MTLRMDKNSCKGSESSEPPPFTLLECHTTVAHGIQNVALLRMLKTTLLRTMDLFLFCG